MSQPGSNENKKLEDYIYSLLDDLNALVVREQLSLQEELSRVNSIISDAIETLTENFTSLNLKIELQSQYMREGFSVENRELRLEQVNREIDKNLTATIRSLQFEDIVQQLTAHSRNRTVNMENLFVKIINHIGQLKGQNIRNKDNFFLLLNEIKEDIEEFRVVLNRENPVKQQSMHEGGIELFD